MKRSRRRIILKVFVLLAAGAAVNVAVAWGLAVWHTERVRNSFQAAGVPMVGDPIVLLLEAGRDSVREVGWQSGVPVQSMAYYCGDLPPSYRRGWTIGDGDFWSGREFTLPLTPLLPGFAVNTVFYAGVLWLLFCGPFALRRMIRKRRGQCAACAYPIGQNERCTECGAVVQPRGNASRSG